MHPRYCVVLSRRRQNPLVPQGYQTAVLGDAIGKGCHIGHIGQGLAQQVGVLYSDGTTTLGGDDKVGVAGMLEAVRALKEDGIRIRPRMCSIWRTRDYP